jgi:hypothetical protein
MSIAFLLYHAFTQTIQIIAGISTAIRSEVMILEPRNTMDVHQGLLIRIAEILRAFFGFALVDT